MSVSYWRSFWSEWLKQPRSLVTWVIIGCGLLVPGMLLAIRLRQRSTLPSLYSGEVFWEQTWNQAWESLAVMFLPLAAIVLTSLITQVEHRYNGWKQVRATPQRDLAIFSAKLLVVLVTLAQCFAVLIAGIWLVGIVPPLMFPELAFASEPFPLGAFVARSRDYYIDVLPVVAVQFLLSLRSRNAVLPIGVGVGMWTVAISGIGWKYNYVLLYGLVAVDFFSETGTKVGRALPASMSVVALVIFSITTTLAYLMFVLKHDRG